MINYVALSLDAHKRITLEWKGAEILRISSWEMAGILVGKGFQVRSQYSAVI